MADPVGILKQIAEVMLQIKEAVETVRQNEKACLQIKHRVERARGTLSLCEKNAELMMDSAASAALEALGEILGEALRLVTACQERSFMCLCWTAGKLSKQLSKVDQDISSIHLDATFAILAVLFYIISKQNKDSAHPPPPSLESSMTSGISKIIKTKNTKIPLPSPKAEDEVTVLPFGDWDDSNAASGEKYTGIFNRVRNDKLSPNSSVKQPPSSSGNQEHKVKQAEERNLLPEIGQVALVIKEAVQTVRQNKEECIEIDKRVNSVSALLSRFENTETMKDPEMSTQLEKLLKTFRHAHTLVTACQRRNITIISPAGRLSKQLREVLDQTELTLDEMIAISVRCAGTV